MPKSERIEEAYVQSLLNIVTASSKLEYRKFLIQLWYLQVGLYWTNQFTFSFMETFVVQNVAWKAWPYIMWIAAFFLLSSNLRHWLSHWVLFYERAVHSSPPDFQRKSGCSYSMQFWIQYSQLLSDMILGTGWTTEESAECSRL